MFKLPDKFPTTKDDVSDIADSYECNCLLSKDRHTPYHQVFRAASIADDELKTDGIDDEDDEFIGEKLNEVCIEINRRKQACDGKYPFTLENRGCSLMLDLPDNDWTTITYAYLLFATRLNMKKDRVQAGVDGALLFEKLSAKVAQVYWGERAESIVFGTASGGSFKVKVEDLCKSIGEGKGFKNNNIAEPKEKDGKLDIVVWKKFKDGNTGKLIGFGQCKTGTEWIETISQLDAEKFCDKWFNEIPPVKPVRMFFVADSFPIREWHTKSTDAGLVFDRFRIMDFLPSNVDAQLESDVRDWVASTLNFIKAS